MATRFVASTLHFRPTEVTVNRQAIQHLGVGEADRFEVTRGAAP